MGPATVKDILSRSHMDIKDGQKFLDDLVNGGYLSILHDSPQYLETLVVSETSLQNIKNEIKRIISTFHKDHPLRVGIPREELKSRSHLSQRIFNAVIQLLETEKEIKTTMQADSFKKVSLIPRIALPTHTIRFSNSQEVNIQKLMSQFASSPFSPPSVKDCKLEVGEEVFDSLVETNILVQVSAETAFRKTDYDDMVGKIKNEIQTKGQLSLAEARDIFQTSRRYIQALLEHLDAIGVTVRQGEARILQEK